MSRTALPFGLASRFAGAMLALLGALVAWTGFAADPAEAPGLPPGTQARLDAACSALVTPSTLTGLTRPAGNTLQEQLRSVYRDDPRITAGTPAGGKALGDGVVGPVTLGWLQRFCVEFAVPERAAGAPGLVEAVRQFAAILDTNAQDRKILAGRGLGRWIAAQPMPARSEWVTTRLFGTDDEIARLLAAYAASAKAGASTAPKESDAAPVYYELTAADLALLAAPGKALDALAKMKDKPALNADEFDAAVLAALRDAGLLAAEMLPVVRRHAEPRPTQQITADAILALKVRRLPPAAIALAQSVQDVPFPDRAELAGALEDAIQAAAADAAAKDAPKPIGPSATPSPLSPSAAPAPPAPAPADGKTAEAANAPMAPPAAAAAVTTATPVPAPPKPPSTPTLAPFAKELVKASVERVSFVVTDGTLRGLANDPDFRVLPPFLLNILDLMTDVEYPTDELYRAAVYAKVVDSFLQTVDAPKSDKTLKPLAVIEKENPPAAYLAVVRAVDARGLRSSRAVRDALAADLQKLTAPYLPAIEQRARKPYRFIQEKVSSWNGGDCGCVIEDRLPGGGSTLGGRTNAGIVYGLFPIWQTGHEQLIDFTVLSSIGYYAVPFDDAGELLDPLRNLQENNERLDFVDTAHRHGVRVDWVIRRVDWSSWKAMDTDRRARAFDKLVDNIAEMLRESTGSWLRKLASTLSLGGVPAPHRGDGVTLYFDNYPEDRPSIDAFKKFHQNLHNRLRETVGDQYSVNLLFPASSIGTGIHDCDDLAALLNGPTKGAPQNTGKFLVFLREPSIDSKKDLRQVIENCATGKRRKDLQQNIVPVIQYDGYSSAQLTDDVIYFDFNFGGVGLWPHPVASNANAAPKDAKQRVTVEQIGGDIRTILIGERGQTGKVQTGIDRICTFVCPNRWVFRGLFEAFLVLLVASLVLRLTNCRLNFALKARPAYFYLYMGGVVAPTLVLFLSLLYCDPAWEDIREGNIPFLLLAVVFIGFVIWLYVDARRQAAKP